MDSLYLGCVCWLSIAWRYQGIDEGAGMRMQIRREWAMPNKHTFLINPIKDLIEKYVGDGKGWIDPFAGENSPAEFTNDLNPDMPTQCHIEAKSFIQGLKDEYNGCLFDPPYSLRQLKECYESIGIKKITQEDSILFPTNIKDKIYPKIKKGGIVICCGWDSNAFGINRGFEFEEILLVAHGGRHNDTIVTVEKKVREQTIMEFT
jgi:hypothetical protein